MGIGAGAHGKITLGPGQIRRYAKKRQPEQYLAADGVFTASDRLIEQADITGEFMLNALRLNGGFSLDQFEQRTGLARLGLEPGLESLYRRELLQQMDDRVSATTTGRRFLDSVIAEFFPD